MLRTLHRALPFLATMLFVAPRAPIAAQEPVDLAAVSAIRDEGLNRSQAVEHLVWLADVYGPRLTGGEGIRQAADWAKKRFAEWGLQNIHEEPFAFGAGWMLDRFSAHMIAPQVMPIIGMPKSWTAGTGGPVEADVVLAPIDDEADFARFRGKLRGKIVLTQPARAVRMLEGRLVLRMTEDEIREAQSTPVRAPRAAGGNGSGGGASPFARARDLQRRAQEFYRTEGVVALVDRGSDSDESAGGSDLSWRAQRVDGGTIFVGSGGPRTGDQVGKELPAITIAVEQYNRMVRILERDVPVRMELDVRVRFLPETEPRGFNLIAEIPGTDPALKDEVVMLGAHFDSHHGSTGATDNATG
ncbi:MAG TPA: M28 family peptidase, partial [Gemmatimonadaceae bacterium]|nr:M28 family peptidase [Gemmatimonadaceae bacterium]